MELAKIMCLDIPKSKRIICISDIHGQLDVFKQLLDKVKFCDDDILILVGDLCAGRYDNSQSRQTLEFTMTLCKRTNVYAVRGNWDFVGRLPDEQYLLSIGVSSATISVIKEKFICSSLYQYHIN